MFLTTVHTTVGRWMLINKMPTGDPNHP